MLFLLLGRKIKERHLFGLKVWLKILWALMIRFNVGFCFVVIAAERIINSFVNKLHLLRNFFSFSLPLIPLFNIMPLESVFWWDPLKLLISHIEVIYLRLFLFITIIALFSDTNVNDSVLVSLNFPRKRRVTMQHFLLGVSVAHLLQLHLDIFQLSSILELRIIRVDVLECWQLV